MKFNSFTFNMIAGAVLGTLLFVFGLRLLGDFVYSSESGKEPHAVAEAPEKAGSQEAKKEPEKAPETANKDATGAAAETASLASLMAGGDIAKGKKIAKKCAACHSFDKGGKNKVGPNLWGIVGRKIASHEGFAYSDALKAKSSEEWSYESLDAFLTKPKAYIPGTKMGFGGLKKPKDRANVLLFLRSLSDSPKPLPGK